MPKIGLRLVRALGDRAEYIDDRAVFVAISRPAPLIPASKPSNPDPAALRAGIFQPRRAVRMAHRP